MPSRKTHFKSRHGCVQCKARKVKCDERRPSCTRCFSRREDCFYKTDVTQPWSPAAAFLTIDSPGPNTPRFPDRLLNLIPFPYSPISEQSRKDDFPSPDLELMYHYTTASWQTLTANNGYPEIWQEIAPHEAFSRPFLMHGLLAISALHLAHIHPSAAPRYTDLAIQHYTSAVGLLSPVLNDINDTNAVPVFLLSALIVIISHAIPQAQVSPSATDTLQHMIDMFRLQRGIKEVLGASWPWLQDSPIASMLKVDFNEASVALPSDDENMLRHLEERVETESETEELKQAYVAAIRDLRKCYPFANKLRDHPGVLLGWPVMVPPEFLNAVVERNKVAIAILAYYGTLLHELRNIWWATDKGRLLVSATSWLLPPEWGHLVRWARIRVGLNDHP